MDMISIIFFADISAILVALFFYSRSIDKVLVAGEGNDQFSKIRLSLDNGSKGSLLSDVRIFYYVVSGSYKSKITDNDLREALHSTRNWLLIQATLGVIAMIIPIIATPNY